MTSGPAVLSRRGTLRLALIGAVSLLAGAHAPYGQWGIYRKRHLLILTTRADPTSHEIGTRIAALLAERLPQSRARVSRAPHKKRVASLLGSKQMDVALMHRDDAADLRVGTSAYSDHGPVPLHTIVAVGRYLLVCRDDFPDRHAWLISEVLSRGRPFLEVIGVERDPRVPLHPGAQAYFEGRPLPDPEPEAAAEAEPNHGHAH